MAGVAVMSSGHKIILVIGEIFTSSGQNNFKLWVIPDFYRSKAKA